jgi:hypothetical protein
MPHPQFDRSALRVFPLSERPNKVDIDRDKVMADMEPGELSDIAQRTLDETVERMRAARENGKPVMLTFGAHAIKNGLGPVLIRLMEEGWLQHLATNGAGIIHDWELAYQGKTSEDVRGNTSDGKFGLWDETGFCLNFAITLGAYDGLGYGESVGRLIETEGYDVPSRDQLLGDIARAGDGPDPAEKAASAADLLAMMERLGVKPGKQKIAHPWKSTSAQAAAYRLGIPFTDHPMIGHDIIYTHPANHCAAIGRCAQRDFLAFAHNVSRLDGGVYLSIGSAVMSPMIFEKSLSMSQNIAIQNGRHIDNHFIVVIDLAESRWDWSQGEPPADTPDYYLRYCKTFNRMGGAMRYATADNRDFLLGLCQRLDVTA